MKQKCNYQQPPAIRVVALKYKHFLMTTSNGTMSASFMSNPNVYEEDDEEEEQ